LAHLAAIRCTVQPTAMERTVRKIVRGEHVKCVMTMVLHNLFMHCCVMMIGGRKYGHVWHHGVMSFFERDVNDENIREINIINR